MDVPVSGGFAFLLIVGQTMPAAHAGEPTTPAEMAVRCCSCMRLDLQSSISAALAAWPWGTSMRSIWWCGLAVIGGLAGAPDLALARGEKPVLAVIEFENQSSAGWWRGGVGWELAGMLSNELSATNAFKVLKRSARFSTNRILPPPAVSPPAPVRRSAS